MAMESGFFQNNTKMVATFGVRGLEFLDISNLP